MNDDNVNVGHDGRFSYSSASTGNCNSVSPKVKAAFQEAFTFSRMCSAAKLAPGRKIVVNDYTSQGGETMYIFDQEGRCLDTMPISYGSGSTSMGTKSHTSTSCSTPNSGKTPAGMHMTAYHNGGIYNSSNSLKLAGLSGQNSGIPRQILIHASKWGLPAAVSQGCTGVPADKLYKVMDMLGYGSLVYNYFGSGDTARNCPNNAGQRHTCDPEPLARATAKTYNKASVSASGAKSSSGSRTGTGTQKLNSPATSSGGAR